MGLQVRLVLYAPSENYAFRGASAAFEEIARLDRMMSDYQTDSELMRLSARAGTGPVAVSDDLFGVLWQAYDLATHTNGAFDVTASPLVRLWREARRSRVLPDAAALSRADALVGYEHLELDSARKMVSLRFPGMQLDLGGIAKGYAADRALEILEAAGLERVLIEFGGDVRLGAPPPGADGWRVEIAHADSAHRFTRLANAAIASSGDTEQFVEIEGVRYSHVVDPATGIGLTTRVAATVVARTGVVADGLSTALTVLDPEDIDALLKAHYPGADVYLRTVGERGRTIYSTAWTRSIRE